MAASQPKPSPATALMFDARCRRDSGMTHIVKLPAASRIPVDAVQSLLYVLIWRSTM